MAMIEVLVSILIFAFGLLGLIGLEASAINFSVDAEDRNRAALLASEIASSMWLANSACVADATLASQYAVWQANINVPSTPMGLPAGTLNINPNTGCTGTNTADITIQWQPVADNGPVRTLTTRVILP